MQKNSSDEPNSHLAIGADTYRKDGTWYTDLKIVHYHHRVADLHNVTVIGYSKNGNQVCRIKLGNSTQPATLDENITIKCNTFPYLFASKADESPCQEGYSFGIIRWDGTAEQKRQTYPPVDEDFDYGWKEFERRCGEELPPERLLPDEPETTTEESTDS